MDELRWFLLTVGLIVIAGIYGYGRWQDHRRRAAEPRRSAGAGRRGRFEDDEDVDVALRDLDAMIGDINPVDPTGRALPIEPDVPEASDLVVEEPEWRREKRVEQPRAAKVREAQPEPVPQGMEEKVVVIHVAAPEGVMFTGEQLVIALQEAGLEHGEHQIFHRIVETGGGEIALFSAANMLKPGYFDPDTLHEMRSPGVALFMQLPAPFDGLAAFEQMLGVGRYVAEQLGANMLDARRCNLTQQAIEHIREELREYRRRAHLLARQKKGR